MDLVKKIIEDGINSGLSDDQIRNAVEEFKTKQQKPIQRELQATQLNKPEESEVTRLGALGRSIGQGALGGYFPEAVAKLQTGFSDSDSPEYRKALDETRRKIEIGKQKFPVQSIAGEIGGLIAGPGKLLKPLGYGLKGLAAQGAITGAAMNPETEVGEDLSVGENLKKRATSGLIGGAAGPALSLATKGVGSVLAKQAGDFAEAAKSANTKTLGVTRGIFQKLLKSRQFEKFDDFLERTEIGRGIKLVDVGDGPIDIARKVGIAKEKIGKQLGSLRDQATKAAQGADLNDPKLVMDVADDFAKLGEKSLTKKANELKNAVLKGNPRSAQIQEELVEEYGSFMQKRLKNSLEKAVAGARPATDPEVFDKFLDKTIKNLTKRDAFSKGTGIDFTKVARAARELGDMLPNMPDKLKGKQHAVLKLKIGLDEFTQDLYQSPFVKAALREQGFSNPEKIVKKLASDYRFAVLADDFANRGAAAAYNNAAFGARELVTGTGAAIAAASKGGTGLLAGPLAALGARGSRIFGPGAFKGFTRTKLGKKINEKDVQKLSGLLQKQGGLIGGRGAAEATNRDE